MYKVLIIKLLKKNWEEGIQNFIVKDLEDLNNLSNIGITFTESEFNQLIKDKYLEFENIAIICNELSLEEIKKIEEYSQECDSYYSDKCANYEIDNFEQEFTNLRV